MKLQAKILPKYFEELKNGEKTTELRQFEDITLTNSETGEQIVFEVKDVRQILRKNDCLTVNGLWIKIKNKYPNIFDDSKPIYEIDLGKRLKPKSI